MCVAEEVEVQGRLREGSGEVQGDGDGKIGSHDDAKAACVAVCVHLALHMLLRCNF